MSLRATAILAAALAVIPSARAELRSRTASAPGEPRRPAPVLGASPSSLPAEFEANRGQTDPSVRFLARPRGYRAFFADGETVFVLPRGTGAAPDPRDPGNRPPAVADAVRLRFEGARPARPAAGLPLPGRSNYFIGDDPSRWIRDVPRCGDLLARGLYEGIDLRWRGLPGGRLEYDLLLAPGADPGAVAMRFEGARSVSTDAEGRLLVSTEGGVLRHSRPVAYQVASGRRLPVEARFVVEGGSRVRFAVGARDPALPLVIDPEIDYSTFLGGSSAEYVTCLGSDGVGSFYAGGQTSSVDFPVLGAPVGAKGSNQDAFVTKFNAAGSAIVWSTYLGGNETDYAAGLAVGADGSVVVGGQTEGTYFPKVNPLQSANGGQMDGFITKISASGSVLVFSTYLGGANTDRLRGVALASDGSAFVTGVTQSTNFPTTASAFQKTFGGFTDAFVARLNPAGTALAWSTYLGGTSGDEGFGIAVDSADRPVVTGLAGSTNFPTSSPVQASNAGDYDAFITKLSADGTALAWSTYFGGTQGEYGTGVSIGPDGRVWIAGGTESPDFPASGAFQPAVGGVSDAFVLRMAADGSAFQMAGCLGGAANDFAIGIAVDKDGSAFVAGITDSTNFPLRAELQGTKGAYFDFFLAQFPASGATLPFSTYIGGSGDDRCFAVAVDVQARVAVGGYANGAANSFPIVNAYDGTLGGTLDGTLTVVKRLPFVPNDLSASLVSLTSVELLWTDTAVGESAFRLERSTDGIVFGTLVDTPANATSHIDASLAPATTYHYRISTIAGAYVSDPSEAVSVTTPATPTFAPNPPSGLTASVVNPRRVDLAWQDNSDNEDFFTLARAEGPALFGTLATPSLGMTTHSDATVLPGRTYSWKVRAQNPISPSLFSNTETVTMPSTIEVAVTKGRIADKAAIRKDAVTLAGTFAYGADAEHAAFDPSNQALTLRLGTVEDPALLNIPVPADGWVLRKGKYAWKSPKGSSVKAKVTVDPALNAFTVKLTGLTLPVSTANPLRVTVTLGTDAGFHLADWTAPTKAGLIKFPVPAPK